VQLSGGQVPKGLVALVALFDGRAHAAVSLREPS
jgi:hypothetical protein